MERSVMKSQAGYTAVEALACLGVVVWFILLVGVIYVACHFLAKFW